jgi:hypothetical protein
MSPVSKVSQLKSPEVLDQGIKHNEDMYTTTCSQNFSLKSCQFENTENKQSKFRAIQTNGMAVLQYKIPTQETFISEPSTTSLLAGSSSDVSLDRTNSRLLTEKGAPVAVGRSGLRVEKGISASGLLGERYDTSDDPKRNSFVQRSWLPTDDPALVYKRDGKPEAHMPNDVSLAIGEGPSETERFHGNFRRTACITAPSRKGGLFGDEY